MNEKVATILRDFKRKDKYMSITRVIFIGSNDDQVYENRSCLKMPVNSLS